MSVFRQIFQYNRENAENYSDVVLFDLVSILRFCPIMHNFSNTEQW